MKFRRRTIRRLGVFLIVVALVATAALWMHGRGERRQAQSLAEQRAHGMELIAAGDFDAALRPLANYLSEGAPDRTENDFEARLAYARARLFIVESGDRHIEQCARLLRDLVDDFSHDPRRRVALHLLMQATREGGDWNELRRISDETLDSFPDDEQALRMRRRAAEELGDLRAALADSQRLNALAPHNLDEQLWSLRLLARLDWPPETIVRHAEDLVASNTDDPRFLLILAVAYEHAGQEQQAIACLRQAEQSELPEDDRLGFVKRLAGLFDAFDQHAQARNVYARALEKTPKAHPDVAALQQLLALRTWQAGRLADALAVIPPLTREQRRTSVELFATRILLQFEHGETAEARLNLAMLRRSVEESDLATEHRRLAMAWHEALGAAYAHHFDPEDRPSLRARLETMQRAHMRLRDHQPTAVAPATDDPSGLLLKWAGDLYSQMGETELAVRHWRAAARHLPGWDDPHLLVAEGSLRQGLLEAAEVAALTAASRAMQGDGLPAQVLLTRIAYRQWIESPSTGGAQEAAAMAEAHQRNHPLDPGTLPIHVHLLALSDPEAARKLVTDRLQIKAEPALRVELARVSDMVGLGLEDALLADLPHPQAALARAREHLQRGSAQSALKELDPPADLSPEARIEWDVARATFLQQVQPDEAAALWQHLSTNHASNLAVQTALLESQDSLRLDRQLVRDTIHRLAELTGPAGRRWRIEHARWLLAEQTPAAALDAAELLRGLIRDGDGPDTVDARLLLADALMLGGNQKIAVEHLEAAYALAPKRGDVGLRLVGMLERSGRRSEAGRLLGRLAAEGVRGARERLEVAARLARDGNLPVAISLLQQADGAGQLQPEGQAFLTQLLQRYGRIADARKSYERMLSAPSPSPTVLLSAALFFRSEGDARVAASTLARLEAAPLAEADRQLLRAIYHARTGDFIAAENAFAAALTLVPEQSTAWREAMAFLISRGEPESALEISRRAAEAGVPSDRLQVLVLHAQAMVIAGLEAGPAEQRAALGAALAAEGSTGAWRQLPAILSLEERLLRERRNPSPSELAQLEQVAEIFDVFIPLQTLLIDTYIRRGSLQEVPRIARRLADAAIYEPEAQRLAFESCRDAGLYSEAEHFALRWRLASDSAAAQLGLAEARLLNGRYAEAIELLLPHLETVAEQPSGDALRALTLAAEAHAALGNLELAVEVIEPRLVMGPAWRRIAMRMAVERIPSAPSAVRWLEAVGQALDEVAYGASLDTIAIDTLTAERLELATAWARVGERFSDQEALQRGRDQLAEFAAGPMSRDPRAWEALGEASLRAGDRDEAEAAYRRVLTLDPRRPEPASRLAGLLLEEEEAQSRVEALTWAKVAVEQDASNANCQQILGWAHLATRDRPRAQDAFESALRLDDRNLPAMVGLTRVLADSGEVDRAGRWYRRVQMIAKEQRVEDTLSLEIERLSVLVSDNSP